MNPRYRPSFWGIANGILAVWLVITLVGGPRRLAPDWMTLQTWSMHWEGPDGRPLSTNFIFQTSKPRQEFGPFLHEYHWFGPPTIEMPVPPNTRVLKRMPVLPEPPASPTEHNRLLGKFVE